MCKHLKCSPRKPSSVAKQDWKLMLNRAQTFSQRIEAVRTAISLGAALCEIEEYLDYLSFTNPEADVQPHD